MRRTFIAIFFAGLIAFGSGPLLADDTATSSGLSDAQRGEVEALIERYIKENPEIIVRAVQEFQRQERHAREQMRLARLSELQQQLENSPTSPIGGNPNGDVTLIEFFDYRCGYCKRVHDTVVETVKADGNVRLIYKEFPILGPESQAAARMALAVHFVMPEKYKPFNDALMRARGTLSEERMLQIANDIGIATDALRQALSDPRIEQEIRHNIAVARELDINGTPAFVIGNRIVPGAVDAATLRQIIAEARQG